MSRLTKVATDKRNIPFWMKKNNPYTCSETNRDICRETRYRQGWKKSCFFQINEIFSIISIYLIFSTFLTIIRNNM